MTACTADRAEAGGVERLVPEAVARHVLVRVSRLPAAASPRSRAPPRCSATAPNRATPPRWPDWTRARPPRRPDALVAADILAAGRPLDSCIRCCARSSTRARARAASDRARRAARLLLDAGADPERTASQLLACEPAGADWAVQILRAAAAPPGRRGAASHSAVTYLARALEEPPVSLDLPGVLTELGLAEASERCRSAPDHLAEALRLTRIRSAGP